MKSIKCELCGSNDVVKKDDLFVCQYCGTKYTPEEAKKLLVEISGEQTLEYHGDVNVMLIGIPFLSAI